AKTSAAALSMITKEKSPMRILFFRDHAQRAQADRRALAGESSRRAGKDLGTANPVVRRFRQLEK
ncbi:MAG: hypothetical protein WAK58_14735, partial [Trebonia sp.]